MAPSQTLLSRVVPVLFMTIISSVVLTEALTKPSAVRLVNNGYTGIEVAIHEDEPENRHLIDAIKRMFVKASPYLYTATKRRAFFKEVTILVPSSWSDDPSYGSARKETFEGADIIVAPRNPRFAPDEEAPASPYTKHFEGCGKQAIYIHFTSQFLLDDSLENSYGDFGRVLVHEWGHFRWGLFNEYPDTVVDGKRAKYFYHSTLTGLYEPVACPRKWNMMALKYTGNSRQPYRLCSGNPKDGYEEGCFSIAQMTQPEFSASIMNGNLAMEQIIHFCDNDTDDEGTLHNNEADNKQNRLCGGRSSWEVMREHNDFRDGANPSRDIDDVEPTFKIVRVKETGRPVVLVLDTSGSMLTNNRATKLASAVRGYLTSTISDGCRVGIVDFDKTAKTLSDLRQVDSDDTRRHLASLIKVDGSGGTCIACGLRNALDIIPANEGGKIILITDGQDGNRTSSIDEIQAECIGRGIIVDSIAFSDSAQDNIRSLADETGGKFFLQTDDPHSAGASEAFNENSGCSTSSPGRIILLSRVYAFTPDDAEHRDFISVDPTVGMETKFTFSYFVRDQAIDVSLTSPSGVTFNNTYQGYYRDLSSKKITVSIKGIAEAGTWQFIIMNRHSSPQEVIVSVSSLPSREGVEPIVIKSFLSGTDADVTGNTPFVAYAEVRQGFYPIVQARVVATIERPRTADGRDLGPVEMILKDNGAGFDVTKNDGVYTKSFTKFTGIGYYGLSVRVENDGEAIVMRPSRGSRIDPYINPADLLKGILPEYANTTLLLPGAPIPENVGVKAPNFTRGISAGASRVSETPVGWTPESDILSPGKIFDLSVSSSDFDSATVNITFTAPGDDLDSGTATSYIIVRSNSSDVLKDDGTSGTYAINNVDILYGNLSSPSEFGTEETFSIRVPIQEGEGVASFFFAIFAEDEEGNKGELSNIVQATLREYIPPALEDIVPTTPKMTTIETSTSVTTQEPCRPNCKNGGICTERRRCRCPLGYNGRACETVVCQIQCQNGGYCPSPYKCKCRPGYKGQRCQITICSPPCMNGGVCDKPGHCQCKHGYSGINCLQAECEQPCHNGGYCARPDVCKCRRGFQGKNCQTASCSPPCRNGGRCVGKNRCSCTSGYEGKACEKPKCISGCRNGGTCLEPNICLCRPGYEGGSCHIRSKGRRTGRGYRAD